MNEIEKGNATGMVLLVGGLIGMLAGVAAAYMLIRKQEKTGQPIKFSSSDGMKLGMSTFSLMKLVSDIAVKPK